MNETTEKSRPWLTTLQQEFKIDTSKLENIFKLLHTGHTIPYLAKFQKELVENNNEYILHKLVKRQRELQSLEEKKTKTIKFFSENNLLSSQIETAISNSKSKAEINDIYLPHQPNKQSKGTNAAKAGLAPLADLILQQKTLEQPLEALASDYINAEKNLTTSEQVLEGMRALASEKVSENTEIKKTLRRFFYETAKLSSKALPKALESKTVYEDYYDFSAPLKSAANIKYLAIQRGERQKFLSTIISIDDDAALDLIYKKFIATENPGLKFQLEAIYADAYHKFLRIDLQNEIKQWLWENAQENAMGVYTQSFQSQLMQAPLGAKSVLAIYPGQEAGCAIAALNDKGECLESNLLFFHDERKADSTSELKSLLEKHQPQAIALGTGDYSKETKSFLYPFLKEQGFKTHVFQISSVEASSYAASEKGQVEFGEDCLENIRCAIYLGRKLQDPVRELVKIDPLTLNLGSYQKDVDQQQLLRKLKNVLEITVNRLGVSVNFASPSLLQYVAGLNLEMAHVIHSHIATNGPLADKQSLEKIEGLIEEGVKQAVGFLIFSDKFESTFESRTTIELFSHNTDKITELKEGQKLKGHITNFTPYGIFVDIGLSHDALVHRTQIPEKWRSNFHRVFRIFETLHVAISAVEPDKNRIQLRINVQEKRKPTTKRNHGKPYKKSGSSKSGPSKTKNSFKDKPRKQKSLGTLGDQFKNIFGKNEPKKK